MTTSFISVRRALFCALVPLFLIIIATGVGAILRQPEWVKATADYEAWVSGKQARCEALFSSTTQEIQSIDAGRCTNPAAAELFACLAAERALRKKLVDALFETGCPVFVLDSAQPPVLGSLNPPGSQLEYAIRTGGASIELLAGVWAGWFALMYLLATAWRFWRAEPNRGVQRLLVVVAGLAGVVAAGIAAVKGVAGVDVAGAGVAGMAGGWAVAVLGLGVGRWVKEGFRG